MKARWWAGAAALLAPLCVAAQSCTVSATATSFGAYNPQAVAPNDANGTVTLSCAPHPVALVVSYTVSLSAGSAGSFAARKMASGGHTLQYQLYTNLARTTPWGDGSAGTSAINGGLTLSLLVPVTVPYTVYGRIPAPQSTVAAGSYSDLITVTVAY